MRSVRRGCPIASREVAGPYRVAHPSRTVQSARATTFAFCGTSFFCSGGVGTKVVYSSLDVQVGAVMPCGFCGHSANPLCSDIEINTSGSVQVQSKCPLFRKIAYANANRGTVATPCRNVPIRCRLCPDTPLYPRTHTYRGIWRYNMDCHIRTEHREYAAPGHAVNHGRLPLPARVWEDMQIKEKEYIGCGIHESLIPSPFSHFQSETPPSPIVPLTPSGGKRSRAFTQTMTDLPARKQPRHK